MIRLLTNPYTEEYKQFKQHVLSNQFAWYWLDCNVLGAQSTVVYDNFGFYQQEIVKPPERRDNYVSPYLKTAFSIFRSILSYNDIEYNRMLRCCVNNTHSTKSHRLSIPHNDHPYPHTNLLVYLTDTNDGETICDGQSFYGEEDDVIIFQGLHCMRPPLNDRRIVIVYTYE